MKERDGSITGYKWEATSPHELALEVKLGSNPNSKRGRQDSLAIQKSRLLANMNFIPLIGHIIDSLLGHPLSCHSDHAPDIQSWAWRVVVFIPHGRMR